ncbi:MAG: hypothetical protein KDA57_21465, partial [Planctomycetales bacterium]|nr:hypothetical protein [Planctomycetales bacterium]
MRTSNRLSIPIDRLATGLASFVLAMGFALSALSQEAPETASDTFEIPAEVKTIEQLFAFVEEVADHEPEGQSEQEFIAHHRKIARTVVQIADKVLALNPSDEEAMQGYSFKLQALQMLKELGVVDAEQAFSKTVAEARADSRPDVAAIGVKFFIETGFDQWATLGAEDQSALIDAIVGYVGESGSG